MMKCPIDTTQLEMMERSGVEIDYCPQCRGIWLDRGELDKIVDRASGSGSSQDQDGDENNGGAADFLGELFNF